jgi:carbamate kinase
MYMREEAERLAREHGWVIAADNDDYRRVVRSPLPKHIFEIRVIEFLVKMGGDCDPRRWRWHSYDI